MTASSTQKNILLIVVDQWRGDSLSCVGHPTVQTPNLDALAGDGTLFRRHYSQGSPCGPGRASLLTGMYVMNHRVVRNSTPLDRRHDNLGNLLSQAGYDPALIGYTTSTPDPRHTPANHRGFRVLGDSMDGFRIIVGYEPDKRPYFSLMERRGYKIPEEPLDFWLPGEDPQGREGWGPTFAPAPYPAEESDTAFFTEEALSYLRFQRGNWFLHLGYWRPHPPFIAPIPYHDMYDPADVPAPARAETAEIEARQHPLLAYSLKTITQLGFFRTGKGLAAELGEREIRQLRATYYGLLRELDDQVGRVIAWLKETGQYDHTLIILTSDHGEELGDHYLLGKQAGYFDGSYHIPLIVRDPYSAEGRGRVVEEFSENVDVLPTILEWLEQPLPRQLDGRSLLSFCRGETPPDWRTEVHYEYDFREVLSEAPQRELGVPMDRCSLGVVQDRRFKYVHFAALPPLLFDLEEDPKQLRNLADDSGYKPIMLAYAQKMLSWRMENMERTLTGMAASDEGLVVRA